MIGVIWGSKLQSSRVENIQTRVLPEDTFVAYIIKYTRVAYPYLRIFGQGKRVCQAEDM